MRRDLSIAIYELRVTEVSDIQGDGGVCGDNNDIWRD